MEPNKISLKSLCASLAQIIGVEKPEFAEDAYEPLTEYAKNTFGGKCADRIFMYNPDAIAQWIYKKYSHLVQEATDVSGFKVPFCTVMPSVTPVCFGTMYTGAEPSIHGITRYEKPVIKIDSIFDAMIRAGKKCAIVSTGADSMSKIFLEREMDYFIFETAEEVTAKASELIIEDEYDFIAVYNAKYDALMHKFGPESIEALSELRANSKEFATYDVLIRNHWKNHNTLLGFAMDHGCHEIDGGCGSHGLDMWEDLNIMHLYKAYGASEK